MKKKNVYIIGNVLGAYRSQAALSALIGSNKYNVNFNNFSFLNTNLNKDLFRFIKVLDVFFSSIFRFYFLLRSDIVFVLAMNNNKFIQLQLAKVLRKTIITDFYISYYDTNVIDRKNTFKKSFKASLYRFFDVEMLKAKQVFFLNQSEANYYINIVQEKELFNVNYSILPLCIDKKKEASLPFYKSSNSDMFSVCWWGTFIPLHGLEKIIYGAQILKEKGFNFTLSLFGDSVENAKPFQILIEKLNLNSNVFIYNDYSFSNGKLESYLVANCDLALGAFGDSEKAKTVITNKVLDAISMKIPVISCYSTGIEEYFKKDIDIFLCRNEPEEIAAEIINAANCSVDKIQQLLISSFRKFERNFSYDAFKMKILKDFNNL